MKANEESKTQWRNSTHYRLSVRFILILACSILILSLSIISITIVELYDSTKEQSRLLVETMQKADTESQEEWIDFLETYTSGESSPYYVRTALDSGEVIYSHEAKALFADFSQFRQFFLFNDILWTEDFEPYYYMTADKGEAKVAILVEMDEKFELVEGIISLTGTLTVLILILGSVIIYRFARNFSKPLVQMDQEISC